MQSVPTHDGSPSSSGSPASHIGKKIKHFMYHPLDKIGSGFSSTVYKGTNTLTSKSVAIKVIDQTKVSNSVEKYLLANEIEALEGINHSNVLKTVEILMTKNNVYIVTEYCEDGDLQMYIQKQGRLGEP